METRSETALFPRLDTGFLPLAPRRILGPNGEGFPVWREQMNLRAHDGELSGRPALDRFYSERWTPSTYTPIPNTAALGGNPDSDIVHIESVFAPQFGDNLLAQSTFLTVVITRSEVYINTTYGTWINCMPTYSTGTVTATNGSASITGAGTAWVTAIARGSILIDGAWYKFEPFSDTAAVITPVFAGATAAGKAYTARRWFITSFEAYGAAPFYQIYNGSLFVASSNGFIGSATSASGPVVMEITGLFEASPVTTVLTCAQDFLGTIDEQTELGGLVGMQILNDGRVYLFGSRSGESSQSTGFYSSHLSRAVWTASPGGFTDIVAKPGSGTALGKLGDVLTHHYTDGVVMGFPSGQDDPPIDYRPSLASSGCVAARTLKAIKGKEWFLAADFSVRVFDGNEDAKISEVVRWANNYYLSAGTAGPLSFANTDRCFAAYNRRRGEYLISLPLTNGTNTFPINVESGVPSRWMWPTAVTAMSDLMYGDPGQALNVIYAYAFPGGQPDRGYCIVGVEGHPVTNARGLMVLNEHSAADCLAFQGSSYGTQAVIAKTDELPFGQPCVEKTIDRVTLWFSGSSPVSGCFDFNGSTEYASAGSNSAFNFTSGAFTVEFWLLPRSIGADQWIVQRGLYLTDGWAIVLAGVNGLYFRTNQAGASQPTVSTNLTANVLVHAALVRSGASAQWYLNGVAANSSAGVHVNPLTSARSLLFGRDVAASGFFNGKLDVVRIWNVARSGADILANYQSIITSHANLIGNWPCDEAGLVAHDLSATKAHATLQVATDSLVSPGLLAPTGPTLAVTGAVTKTLSLTSATQMQHFYPTPVTREGPQITITQGGPWQNARYVALHQMQVSYATEGESMALPR